MTSTQFEGGGQRAEDLTATPTPWRDQNGKHSSGHDSNTESCLQARNWLTFERNLALWALIFFSLHPAQPDTTLNNAQAVQLFLSSNEQMLRTLIVLCVLFLSHALCRTPLTLNSTSLMYGGRGSGVAVGVMEERDWVFIAGGARSYYGMLHTHAPCARGQREHSNKHTHTATANANFGLVSHAHSYHFNTCHSVTSAYACSRTADRHALSSPTLFPHHSIAPDSFFFFSSDTILTTYYMCAGSTTIVEIWNAQTKTLNSTTNLSRERTNLIAFSFPKTVSGRPEIIQKRSK